MGNVRTLGVVTVGRSDYGICVPILRAFQAEPGLRLWLYVGGTHLEPGFGDGVSIIEADGFPIHARVPMGLTSDEPEAIARSVGMGVEGFGRAFARSRPDLLLIVGDRFDMYCAALAAMLFRIPLAHVHGGELTLGAMDDALRHSMTKLSHLHFVATAEYARRVVQLGEEPWRVTVSGAPSLDNLRGAELLPREHVERAIRMRLSRAPMIVTFHPATLEKEEPETQIEEVLAAVDTVALPTVFTAPNADTGSAAIRRVIGDYVQSHPEARLIENVGSRLYFTLMSIAGVMVGNSSSGLIEAASFRLPVVNVGDRQLGRVRPANVVDVPCRRENILCGIQQALGREFRESLRGLVNPYGDGNAAALIVKRVKEITIDDKLMLKKFIDCSPEPDRHL